MGNYRFRLLDMIPNAWFYKLKYIGNKPKPKPKPKTQNNTKKPKPQQHQQQQQQQQSFVQHRNSYYFTSNEPFKPSSNRLYNSPTNPNFSDVHFLEPPLLQKTSETRPRRRPTRPNSSKLVTTSSVSAGCRCRASIESSAKIDSTPDSSSSPNTQFNSEPVSSWSSSSSCKLTSSATDIIIDVEKNIYKFDGIAGLDSISEIELPPPILTKPAQLKNIKKRSPLLDQRSSATTKIVNEESVKKQNQFQCTSKTSPRIYSISPRVKLLANSPKIRANRKPAAATTNIYSDTTTLKTLRRRRKKKQVSESFAIMKSSFDPQKDFRDSMVEMIVENNLRASKDLEELLACYLSLNSNEYHGLIVKVFEQIWFDLIEI